MNGFGLILFREDEDIPIDEVDLTSEASAATFKTFVSGVSDCTVSITISLENLPNEIPSEYDIQSCPKALGGKC